MSDYMVRFNVHLIPMFKPDDWPNPVIHEAAFRAETFDELRTKIDAHLWLFMKQRGVVILKESRRPHQDDITTLDLRQFVPFHMISFVEHTTTPLVGDVPDIEDEDLFIQ